MAGNGRCGHTLNVEEAYLSRSHARILSIFSGTHGNGSLVGRGGVGLLTGNEHSPFTDVLQPRSALRELIPARVSPAFDPNAEPTLGKLCDHSALEATLGLKKYTIAHIKG